MLMTRNATNFINPITFETLTGNKCLVDTFDRNFQFQVEHVSIAKKADVVMIDVYKRQWQYIILDFETGETVFSMDVASKPMYNNMAIGMYAGNSGNRCV